MTKQEVSEIKKLFTPRNCSITRVTGCYVDAEKNIKSTFAQPFLSLPEEEMFKYFEILKKSLSGTIEKNLHTLEFTLEAEQAGNQQHSFLMLRDSKLKNPEMLMAYYQKIIDSYSYVGNYLILMFHDVYDVPGKTSDGNGLDDASEEIYEYILTCICPVTLAKPGLSFCAEDGQFHNAQRQWMVGMPDRAFLFPAFNDRGADIHSILCYEKKPEEKDEELMEALIGKSVPLTAGEQKETFTALIEGTLGENCDMEVVKEIHKNLTEQIEEHAESPEPLILGKEEIKSIFAKSGVSNEKMADFDEQYDSTAGEKTQFAAINIVNAKAMEVKTPDVIIKVNPDRTDLVETAMVEGRKCLVIELGSGVSVNGIAVSNT